MHRLAQDKREPRISSLLPTPIPAPAAAAKRASDADLAGRARDPYYWGGGGGGGGTVVASTGSAHHLYAAAFGAGGNFATAPSATASGLAALNGYARSAAAERGPTAGANGHHAAAAAAAHGGLLAQQGHNAPLAALGSPKSPARHSLSPRTLGVDFLGAWGVALQRAGARAGAGLKLAAPQAAATALAAAALAAAALPQVGGRATACLSLLLRNPAW